MNKTFAELGYNVGDTVRCVDSRLFQTYTKGDTFILQMTIEGVSTSSSSNGYSASWELVSRAGSTVTADDEYLIWSDMTPEAQGTLLLAEHNGVVIQMFISSDWNDLHHSPCWFGHKKYRVKPADPVVVAHEIFGYHRSIWAFFTDFRDTHKITYNTIDGVIDCSSVVMTKI
jgi:hypothetical protein